MERSRLVAKQVGDVNYNIITHVGRDRGNGPLAIDADCRSVVGAIWVRRHPGHVEVVGNGGCKG